MSDSDFQTKPVSADKSHDVDVPVKQGLSITVPGLKGAPPAPAPPVDPLKFYDWPRWLVKAQRSQKITAALQTSSVDPVIQNGTAFTAEADSGAPDKAPRKLLPNELATIKASRAAALSGSGGKLKLSRDPVRGVYGFMYVGRHPADDKLIPAGLVKSAQDQGKTLTGPTNKTFTGGLTERTLAWAQCLVWNELTGDTEGGYASINCWDRALLTWGQGWAMTGGPNGLPGLMKRVWAVPEMRDAFLEAGISWDSASSSFSVVNLAGGDGVLETGPDALQLIIGSRDLAAVFVDLGESSSTTSQHPVNKTGTPGVPFRQALVDAEYDQIMGSQVGKPPAALYTNAAVDPRLIMLMAHVGHGQGSQMWKYTSKTDVRDFLMAWGQGGWNKLPSGAYEFAPTQILTNLKTWGLGIAFYDAVATVSKGSINSFTADDVKQAVNKPLLDGLLAIRDNDAKGYYFYPRLPGSAVSDDELFNWVADHGYFEINALLGEAEKLGARAKSLRANYDTSKRTPATYGYRPQVALDAVLAKKAGASAHTKLYADAHYKELPEDQQAAIRKYLGDKPASKSIWDYWDAKDYDNFFLVTRPYSMEAMLSAYNGRGRSVADLVRQQYDAMGQPWGTRQWIALMAVYNKGGGQYAAWIINHPGYKSLPYDQRVSIRKTVGLPHTDADMAADGV